MVVKVILLRRVPAEVADELKPMLMELRALALAQPGYVSGETLMNAEDPEEYLVISTWTDIQYWNNWLRNGERMMVQRAIDTLLGRETLYQVYYNA
jgi:heme oxygenase (mycobilin-producing)